MYFLNEYFSSIIFKAFSIKKIYLYINSEYYFYFIMNDEKNESKMDEESDIEIMKNIHK